MPSPFSSSSRTIASCPFRPIQPEEYGIDEKKKKKKKRRQEHFRVSWHKVAPSGASGSSLCLSVIQSIMKEPLSELGGSSVTYEWEMDPQLYL
jgi:hypothetical protein